jgi:hypothetical protein
MSTLYVSTLDFDVRVIFIYVLGEYMPRLVNFSAVDARFPHMCGSMYSLDMLVTQIFCKKKGVTFML